MEMIGKVNVKQLVLKASRTLAKKSNKKNSVQLPGGLGQALPLAPITSDLRECTDVSFYGVSDRLHES